MDYAPSFAISAAGMQAERTRVDVAATNLANAHTANGYQPLRAVVRSGGFSSALDAVPGSPLPMVEVEPAASRPRMVPDAGHPLANAEGFVAYPGVDPATEMVTLMSALRSYEANVAAMSTARTLVLKTLEIGRSA